MAGKLHVLAPALAPPAGRRLTQTAAVDLAVVAMATGLEYMRSLQYGQVQALECPVASGE